MDTVIIIGGDIVPTETNFDFFSRGDSKFLFGNELLNIILDSNFRIFNLDTVLGSKGMPINKCGPNARAPKETLNAILGLKPTIITLANNHIMDYGIVGLTETVKILNGHGIVTIGAGENINKTNPFYIIKENGIKICILACAEHEFNIAGNASGGANPFDPLETPKQISVLKNCCDYLFVLYHGGKEHYRYPSPLLQKRCRAMSDAGADLVLCQHSHCVGCREKYRGSEILYGQGNFLFDRSDNEFRQSGLLVRIVINKTLQISYIPVFKTHNTVRLADNAQKTDILSAFEQRSADIQRDGFIEAEYEKLAAKMWPEYLYVCLGNSLVVRTVRKLFGKRFLNFIFARKAITVIQNYIECEAHQELFITCCKQFIKEHKK